MARQPKFVALQKLNYAIKNYERASKAAVKARDTLHDAMVKAVETGTTRYKVAKLVGVTPSRVGQIPGMPAGKNARSDEE